jgi:AcrR family transcriptional regulator
MPRTEEANQKIRDERRRHILNVSVQVFARQGVAATRIADIAAAGEMSQGLIYRYFASKEEILEAVVENAMQATLRFVMQAREQPLPPLEKLRWLLQILISGMWTRHEYALVMQGVIANQITPSELRVQVFEHARELQQMVQLLIKDAQEAGEISKDDDPSTLTLMVTSCLQGLTLGKLFSSDPEPEPDPEIILRMLRVTRSP